jgi:probable F420-dependent oxidoreductase
MADLDAQRADLRATLGPVGVWSFALDRQPFDRERALAGELEAMGWPAVWIPEGLGSKEAMAHSALLLASTERLIVATGIASVWARDAYAMANGARYLAEAYPGRFVLGIGASHSSTVELRGQAYLKPYSRIVATLDAMEEAKYAGPQPQRPAPVVLAALGPRMLRLAAERAAGAHPYFVPVEHTTVAREALGPEPFLAPEQAAVIETDPTTARQIARRYMAGYIDLPNYANNLRRLGWSDSDLADGGSDALVDAIVAWGDAGKVAERVRRHLAAGADHVSVQLLLASSREFPLEGYRELRAALGERDEA